MGDGAGVPWEMELVSHGRWGWELRPPEMELCPMGDGVGSWYPIEIGRWCPMADEAGVPWQMGMGAGIPWEMELGVGVP